MPILAGACLHNPSFVGLGHQALAHDFHFENKWLDVPGQHNVATTAQNAMAFWVIFQCLLGRDSLFLRANPRQRMGLGHNAKAVV
jgi:hypothetical protein